MMVVEDNFLLTTVVQELVEERLEVQELQVKALLEVQELVALTILAEAEAELAQLVKRNQMVREMVVMAEWE